MEFLVEHVLVGANPRGKCAIVQFKIYELIWVGIMPLGNHLSFGEDLSGGSIKKPTQFKF